jgi:DNA (cytosine-5)-methyltransferase 1
MVAYYNEIDEYNADWLENLIAAGLLPPGHIDCRDIRDVRPSDLNGYTQCHFFAGIGGWPYALRLSGWPDDRPVWTASCPCPPWSRARVWHRGSAGTRDHRDLWPVLLPLIAHHRPVRLYGEQVAGAKVRPWIDRLRSDLAGIDYRIESDTRKANAHGSPQGRERFYFLADAGSQGGQGLVAGGSLGAARPWRWRGEEDLRSIALAPFEPGDSWPEPLVRSGDDGLSTRVAQLRAYGNAIDPWVAAQFIADAG